MNKRLSTFLGVSKACLNVLMGVLCYLKIIHEIAYLPSSNGGTGRFDYFYSIYDKLVVEEQQILVYLFLVITLVSSLVSIITLFAKNKEKIIKVSHILFSFSIIFFFVLLFYAAVILQYYY